MQGYRLLLRLLRQLPKLSSVLVKAIYTFL